MMTNDRVEENSRNSSYRWRFFRSGGFDQVCLETGADLLALDQLDQKLRVALSCPVKGLEFDARTLERIDGDRDGHIRVPDLIAAAKWAGSMLWNPDDLTKGLTELPPSSIDDRSSEGKQLIAAAREILMNLGKSDKDGGSRQKRKGSSTRLDPFLASADGQVSGQNLSHRYLLAEPFHIYGYTFACLRQNRENGQ
jgi:hypothetical protein